MSVILVKLKILYWGEENESLYFFGHRDCSEEIYHSLKLAIEDLIVHEAVTKFYVGNHGNFDAIALRAVKELKEKYPFIDYCVALAYMPSSKKSYPVSPLPTVLPEGIENVPKRFAIIYRNRWMVDKSDFVIAYINRSFGGAFKSVEYAAKKKKRIMNLG